MSKFYGKHINGGIRESDTDFTKQSGWTKIEESEFSSLEASMLSKAKKDSESGQEGLARNKVAKQDEAKKLAELLSKQ